MLAYIAATSTGVPARRLEVPTAVASVPEAPERWRLAGVKRVHAHALHEVQVLRTPPRLALLAIVHTT